MRRDLQSVNALFPEKRRRRGLMRVFGRDHGLHTGDFRLQRGDIRLQLIDPQHVQRRGDQEFLRRFRQVIVRIYHQTILTDGRRKFHTPGQRAIALK